MCLYFYRDYRGYSFTPENQHWRPNISSVYLAAIITRKWVNTLLFESQLIPLISPRFKTVLELLPKAVSGGDADEFLMLMINIGLSRLSEPCHLVYDIENQALTDACRALKAAVGLDASEDVIVDKTREKRIERVQRSNDATQETVSRRVFERSRMNSLVL